MSPLGSYLVQAGLTVVGIALLGALLLFASRRLGATAAPGPMRLVGRLPLEARRALYLVKVGDKYLVLGGSEGGLTKLAELDGLPPDTAPAPAATFSQLLGGLVPPKRHPASEPADRQEGSNE